MENFDSLIIGAGQGGALARMLAQAGRKTVLIEKEQVGGTCINIGCTPTKTLFHSARVAHLARRGGDYGVQIGPIHIDMQAVRQRKRDLVQEFRDDVRGRLDETPNLELICGQAQFCAPKRVAVQLNDGGTRTLQASTIIIAAGVRFEPPSIEGIQNVPCLDEAGLMELDTVPEHLMILGGGYIALELGQMFRRFGAQVTIIETGPQIMQREDPDIAAALTGILRDDGIEILLQSRATSVRNNGNGIELGVGSEDGEHTLRGSHLLMATGRKSNSDTLNLQAAGVNVDEEGFITVNSRLETNVPGIYALGDIKGGPQFTHIAYDDARVLCANLSESGKASIEGRLIPYTMFTDPQLGRVGLSEKEARQSGKEIRVARLPMDQTARGLESGEARGFWKVIVDARTDLILGGAFLSLEGGEIMTALQIAMLGQLPYTVLRDAALAHPTLAESFNNLFLSLDRQNKRGKQA